MQDKWFIGRGDMQDNTGHFNFVFRDSKADYRSLSSGFGQVRQHLTCNGENR
jgi:hypothetical protein